MNVQQTPETPSTEAACTQVVEQQHQGPTASARRRGMVTAGHNGDASTARAGLQRPLGRGSGFGLGCTRTTSFATQRRTRRSVADPSPLLRRRAALIAAGRNDVGEALAVLLDDSNDVVVEVAAFAWGERSEVPEAVLDQLIELVTGHQDSLCREAAVAALGSIGDQRALPAVLSACKDKATVRRRAVLSLAAFDGEEATAALRSLLDDRDLQVRQSAEELLSIEEGEDI